MQEVREINTRLKQSYKKCKTIKTQFYAVKAKRHKLFSDCLECVSANIDSIYKVSILFLLILYFIYNFERSFLYTIVLCVLILYIQNLVNDPSAQAFILPINPDEPYTGGLNYSCIAPSKYFQPLQHLSGGEKSLASLALLFAIQRYLILYRVVFFLFLFKCVKWQKKLKVSRK